MYSVELLLVLVLVLVFLLVVLSMIVGKTDKELIKEKHERIRWRARRKLPK